MTEPSKDVLKGCAESISCLRVYYRRYRCPMKPSNQEAKYDNHQQVLQQEPSRETTGRIQKQNEGHVSPPPVSYCLFRAVTRTVAWADDNCGWQELKATPN
eukprot:scaffold26892_cov132-Cylindrotheca_fusiformis.AAC.4